MSVLTTGNPIGALDMNFVPQQSPMVDERDPFAMARDKRQQQIIENQSEIDRLKGGKWAAVGRMLAATGAGLSGRDPSSAFSDFNNRVAALRSQNAQLNAGIEDLTLQEAMMRQKAGNNIGTYNPRDYTTESWAQFLQNRDPSVLRRYDAFSQDGVRWVPDGQGGVRPVVSEQQRLTAGDIESRIAQLTKMREEMGKGEGEVAVSDQVGDARADIALKTENAKNNATAADNMYTQANKMRSGLANYDEAIAAIDAGASTGRIQGMLPSFRASTLRFEAAANRLGLDVIGQTTFGALSEGELRLAMETAVPRGMQGPELRDWLVAKRDAEQKLIEELTSAAAYLEEGGSRSRLQTIYGQGKTSEAGDIKRDPAEQQADQQNLSGFKIISVE